MECGAGSEEQKRIQYFLLTSHLNLALCYLRMKEFSHAVENCNKVIWKTHYLGPFMDLIVILPQNDLASC